MSITLPIAPQGFLSLLNTAAKIWKATIIPTFLFYILSLIATFLPDIYGFIYPPAALPPKEQTTWVMFISLIFTLIGVFFAVTFHISTLYRMNNILKFQDVGFGQSVNYGFAKFFPMLGVAILFGLGTLLTGLLLIIPGIIFAVYYFYSLFFVIFGKSVTESFQESYRLIHNHWWRSFFVILFIYFIFFLLIVAGTIIVLIANPELLELTEAKLNQIMESIPNINLVTYYLLLEIFILIPITHFITSYFLGYFYDLHNRKKLEKPT